MRRSGFCVLMVLLVASAHAEFALSGATTIVAKNASATLYLNAKPLTVSLENRSCRMILSSAIQVSEKIPPKNAAQNWVLYE